MACLAIAVAWPATRCTAQHTIVLRDLTLLHNVRVSRIDADGIELSDRQQFLWHEILRGSVDIHQQEEFDRLLAKIGRPLFRIRARMAVDDVGQLQPMADELYAEVRDSRGATLYATSAARFHDRLHRGQRELAAVPLMELLTLREGDSKLARLDSSLGLTFLESGICQQLLPIWFDRSSAAQALQKIRESSVIGATGELLAGAAAVYDSSLQVYAEPGTPGRAVEDWVPILSAQSAWFNGNHAGVLESLQNLPANPVREQEAFALYYEGLALQQLSRDPDGQDATWTLRLLQVPASFQNDFPELSAAAIYHVLLDARIDASTRETLQQELTGRFAATWHGRLFQNQQQRNTR